MKHLRIVTLLLAWVTSAAPGEAVKSLRVLPPEPGPVVYNIANIFARRIQQRCDARVVNEDTAPFTVELAIKPDIGAEGYQIADGAKGTVRIIGNDGRGLLYGV